MEYIEVCCLNSMSFCYWFLVDSIIVGKHTLYDFNSLKFVEVCFTAQNVVHPDECSMGAWKPVHTAGGGRVLHTCQLKTVDYVIHILCVFADFLSSHPVSFWETSVEVCTYKCGLIFFSSVVFASCILGLCWLVRAHLTLVCLSAGLILSLLWAKAGRISVSSNFLRSLL